MLIAKTPSSLPPDRVQAFATRRPEAVWNNFEKKKYHTPYFRQLCCFGCASCRGRRRLTKHDTNNQNDHHFPVVLLYWDGVIPNVSSGRLHSLGMTSFLQQYAIQRTYKTNRQRPYCIFIVLIPLACTTHRRCTTHPFEKQAQRTRRSRGV